MEKKHKIIKWIRTDDKVGFKANFPIICHHCNKEMFLRNSELTYLNQNWYGNVQASPVLKVMYKCIPCAQVYWFYIERPYIDNDYWNEILKRRDNHFLYVPPPETWSEDARIQQRLKDLGYLGGEIDYKEETEVEEEK